MINLDYVIIKQVIATVSYSGKLSHCLIYNRLIRANTYGNFIRSVDSILAYAFLKTDCYY